MHDSDRLPRFEREARSLAALNHQNIAAIYGLEDADRVKALEAAYSSSLIAAWRRVLETASQ